MVGKRTNKESITTIKLEKETKQRLSRLKEHERETYDQVIRKILYILTRIRKDPVSANRLLTRIDRNIKGKNMIKKEG
jgi:predicted DNA-binding protein